MQKNSFYKLILPLFSIVFASCANQVPPSGGDIDKTPPKIDYSYPLSGMCNFKDNILEFHFSEYVDKTTFRSELSFSPVLKYDPEIEWSGKSAYVKIWDTLQANTTYIVTLSKKIVDFNNKNQMKEPFILKFSTGEKIDKGEISGKIYSKDAEKCQVWLYDLNSTVNYDPLKNKPDYVTQTDNDGNFKLLGIRKSKYRLLAINDKASNLLYDKMEDTYAVADRDYEINETDTVESNISLFLASEDTLVPKIKEIKSQNNKIVELEFSKELADSCIDENTFFVKNDSINMTFPCKGFTKSSKTKYLAIFDIPLTQTELKFFCKDIKDPQGNENRLDSLKFLQVAKIDSIAPKFLKFTPDRIDPTEKTLLLEFDKPFRANNVSEIIQIKNTKFSLRQLDNSKIKVEFLSNLRPNSIIDIAINNSKISNFWGYKRDTVTIQKVKVATGLENCSVSGSIVSDDNDDKLLIFKGLKSQENYKYSTNKNVIKINNLPQDKYVLFVSEKNKGLNYNYGRPYPFLPSSYFVKYADTLNLKSRWPLTDLVIPFKKKK